MAVQEKFGRMRRYGAWFLALSLTAAMVYWYATSRLHPLPQRPLRIGFGPNPPFQVRTTQGFSGLAVDILNEAARRANVRLEWVETNTSSDEAFDKHLVDLWPLMIDLPERRKRIHLTRPYMMGHHILVTLAGSAELRKDFTGRIASVRLPIHLKLAAQEFPRAQVIAGENPSAVMAQVCSGIAGAAFLDKRAAASALETPPPACQSKALNIHNLQLSLPASVASTFESADVADLLRDEIGRMYRDGALGKTMEKYSFYGLDATWASIDMMAKAERSQWYAWSSTALVIALGIALWQALSLRQKKRNETTLRESEERFRAIFQEAGIGVAQLSLSGRVELANDRYCQVVGHRREHLVGRGTEEITHTKDLREHLAIAPRLLSGEIESFTEEKRYQRHDGSLVWATVCKTLVRHPNGQPKCIIAVAEDITERKLAEASLKESEARFRQMADSAPVLIWTADAAQRATFVNKGWLEFTGRTIEQELGRGWTDSIHPEDRERCLATLALYFEQRRNFHLEYRVRRADGEYRHILDHGVARVSEEGLFTGYVGSCIDVTELKNNYERHLATQKLESLGVLSAGVAHDFNNLLGAILARAESAQSELAAGSQPVEDLEEIRLTALRAAEIVTQLMAFARQENALSLAVDLSHVVSETLKLLRVSIAKNAVLKTELATDLPCIYANTGEIRQVVMNLVINASEALEGKSGCITITTCLVADSDSLSRRVCLEVRDTGCGMTDEVKARIFDPFFTTRFAGRGLGLSAVQGIVRRHGGTVVIESTRGEGSCFRIVLPSVEGEVRATEHAPVEPMAEQDSPAVLFVDDEDALRTVVSKLLRRNRFEVVEAADGMAAIDRLRSDPGEIGIILLDVSLPGLSGQELLDELYRIRPEVKVILSTAYSEETAKSEFEGRRIWGFIRKPYQTDDLLKILRDATNGVPHRGFSWGENSGSSEEMVGNFEPGQLAK